MPGRFDRAGSTPAGRTNEIASRDSRDDGHGQFRSRPARARASARRCETGGGPSVGPVARKTNGCARPPNGRRALAARRLAGRHPGRRAVAEIETGLDRRRPPTAPGRRHPGRRARDAAQRLLVGVGRRDVGEASGDGNGEQAEQPCRARAAAAAVSASSAARSGGSEHQRRQQPSRRRRRRPGVTIGRRPNIATTKRSRSTVSAEATGPRRQSARRPTRAARRRSRRRGTNARSTPATRSGSDPQRRRARRLSAHRRRERDPHRQRDAPGDERMADAVRLAPAAIARAARCPSRR